MKRIIRNTSGEPTVANEGNSPSNMLTEPGFHKNQFKPLPWLAGSVCIFALLYMSSYLALLWLPPHPQIDTKSRLTADYAPWAALVFQPVDSAMIDEIRQEQDLPEEIIIDGSFWPTSNFETQPPDSNQTAVHNSVSTPQATLDIPLSSTTAIQPPSTSSPVPTSVTLLPQPTNIVDQVATLISVNTPKPTKPPKLTKPPKPDKPTKPDTGKP